MAIIGSAWLACLAHCGRIGYSPPSTDDFNASNGASSGVGGGVTHMDAGLGAGAGGSNGFGDATVVDSAATGAGGNEEAAFDGADSPDARADTSDAVGRCDALTPLRLYQRTVQVAASTSMIDYFVRVENGTGSPLSLSSVKIRYYLTNEVAGPGTIEILFTDTCCSSNVRNFDADVVTSLQTIPSTPNANAYLEIAFNAALGFLPAGDTIEVELGFHGAGSDMLTQTNDYSFLATAAGTAHEWDICPGPQCPVKFTTCSTTVYRNDVLVWGTPP